MFHKFVQHVMQHPVYIYFTILSQIFIAQKFDSEKDGCEENLSLPLSIGGYCQYKFMQKLVTYLDAPHVVPQWSNSEI